MQRKKIVLLGGGTGASTILRGLKYFPVDITAVITVSDNGRSTGRLRKEFYTPAVGDIRHVLSNLSTLPSEVKDIMEYRMSTYSDLNGHSMGNLILTSLYKKTGSLKTSIEYFSKLLRVEHTVLPLSEDYLTLMGETVDGEIIEGEDEITHAHKKYKRIFYKEDILCRWGGDEFMLYIINAAENMESIEQKCEALQTAMKECSYENASLPATLSIGGAIIGSRSVEETFQLADKALYTVKEQGRDAIQIITE